MSTSNKKSRHITIIGGGISGLSTAYYLERFSRRYDCETRYTLLEASDRFGGKIFTESSDGFIFEAGPDSFITRKHWAVNLCSEIGLNDRLISVNEKHRKFHVIKDAESVEIPSGMHLGIPTELIPFIRSPLLGYPAKARFLLDLIIPRKKNDRDESVGCLIRRRFGSEALESFYASLFAGIYAADADRLSVHACYSNLSEIEKEYGSLIRGARAHRRMNNKVKDSVRHRPAFMSLQGGMTELIVHLADSLRGELRLRSTVTGVAPVNSGFKISIDRDGMTEELATDTLVFTTPSLITAKILESLNRPLADTLKGIRHVSSGTVYLGYERADVKFNSQLTGTGFIVPSGESRLVSGCTFVSNKFSNRAPTSKFLMRAFVGGEGREEQYNVDDGDLYNRVLREINNLTGIDAEPVIHKIFRWPQGNPQYDVGHLGRISEIAGLLEELPGIHVTGCAIGGVGIPDCVRNGVKTAERICKRIKRDKG